MHADPTESASASIDALGRRVIGVLDGRVDPRVDVGALAAEICIRAEVFVPALQDERWRGPLLGPWLERAAGHEPAGVDVWTRAAVMAVVRNCHGVESLHAQGLLGASAMVALSTATAEPMAQCLADAQLSGPVSGAVQDLARRHPVAWAAFGGVARAWGEPVNEFAFVWDRGDDPEATGPSALPPPAGEGVGGGSSTVEIDCGTSQALPPGLHHQLSKVISAGERGVMTSPTFSQIGRSHRRLLAVVDALLSHGCRLRTVNYLLGPDRGYQRVPPLVPGSGRAARDQLADAPSTFG